MTSDSRRITLICRGIAAPTRTWNVSRETETRNILLRSYSMLSYALRGGLSDFEQDVQRVVIDYATSAAGFLELLSSLPPAFNGDLLYIREDGTGFLSAPGRGDGRVLYALGSDDVQFYLTTHDLTRTYAIPERRTA
jgi:hypothetical protein